MKRKALSILFLAVILTAPAHADAPQPRLITVTGEGEVMVVPDEVWVNLQVESFDENLAKAKEANDVAIKQVLDIVRKYQVAGKDFQTDHFNVRNEERYFMDPATNQQRSKRGFFVTKNVSIVLRDVSKFEALYSDALEAGVNNIYGVEFKTSRIKELRDEVRGLAAVNAKQKAEFLAGKLGESVGRAYQISENVQSDSWPRPMMMVKSMAADSAGSSANNETVALGQIKVTSSVTVSFELK